MFGFYSDLPKDEKDKNLRVRVTVVGEHTEGMLKVAVSRCSRKDNFVKKNGRGRAEKRLKIGKLYKEIPMQECKCKDFINIAAEIAEEVRVSKVIFNPRTVLEKVV